MEALAKKIILGVAVTDASKERVLQYITKSLETSGEPYYIVTPNPEIIVSASRNSSFRMILNQARIALPDGVGVTVAARILGKNLKERISGTDCLESLCADVAAVNSVTAKKPITVGFLGGRRGVAEKTAECLIKKYPGLNVAFVGEEWGNVSDDKWQMANGKEKKHEKKSTAFTIDHLPSTIDILFVAFGFPKQEQWMAEHVGKIPVKVMMGVGGAFDYLSGEIPRAPFFLRSIGLEWLFRLVVQPWRLRRQIALLSFILLVIKERLTGQSE